MGFESIKSQIPKGQEEKDESTEQKENSETILGKIRQKTGHVARGLALLGGLSVSGCNFDRYSPGADPGQQPTELALHLTEKKLSEREYFKLCQENPEKAFVTAPLYDGESWSVEALKRAARNDPFRALQYASRYQDNPEYDAIISLTIDALEELGRKSRTEQVEYPIDVNYELEQFASAWINTSRAHQILEDRKDNEYFFIPNFKELSKSKEGYDLGRKIIEKTTKSNPSLVLENLSQFIKEPWGEEIIKQAALKEPGRFFDLIFLYPHDKNEEKETRDKLAIAVARLRPDVAVVGAGFHDEDAISTADCQETEEGKKLMELLKNSGDNKLEFIPIVRKMIFSGELEYLDAQKISLILNYLVSSEQITIKDVLKIAKNSEDFSKVLIDIIKKPNSPTFHAAEEHFEKERLKTVEKINNLHERSDQERFAALDGSSAEMLYFTISYAEEEMFTSSFNGIFDRLMASLKKENISGFQLLKQENFNKFRTFVRTCTEFGRWNDFLATMNKAEQNNIFQQFISDIDKSEDPVREAVSIAEVINTTNDPLLLSMLEKEIQKQIAATQSAHKPKIEILYKLIATTFSQKGMKSNWLDEIEKTYKLPSLSKVKSSELFNSNGSNIQEYFFYDDEDGRTSFDNFLAQYKKSNAWSVEDAGDYVVISSHQDKLGIKIYANKPKAEVSGPEKIASELEKEKIQTLVVVHRGHSYHAAETIKRIPAIAKIVSLGSCGGYRNISEVLDRAPNAHIISTKGTGTKYVNDPLFKMLNEEILSGHDIIWSNFWEKARKIIGDDRFEKYVAPDKNFGAIFIKAYEQALKNQAQTKN